MPLMLYCIKNLYILATTDLDLLALIFKLNILNIPVVISKTFRAIRYVLMSKFCDCFIISIRHIEINIM